MRPGLAERLRDASRELRPAIGAIRAAGGRPLLVGGCVRDAAMGLAPKDLDVEVFGLAPDRLAAALSRLGRVDGVGASFGVLKFGGCDFSVPRREAKAGPGHRGFDVAPDPSLPPETASLRRDFTINAMAWDPSSGDLLDFHGGMADLAARRLRHVGPAFAEDPLRVLRGMGFCARLGLRAGAGTLDLCRSLRGEYPALPRERVWEEWRKWAARGTAPGAGLEFLEAAGWMGLFPEIWAMRGVRQDPVRHPEGDALTHTGHACDAAAAIARREGLDAGRTETLVLAALCHDMGKPSCTTLDPDGTVRSRGHAEAGEEIAMGFLASIGAPAATRAACAALTRCHMAHIREATPRAARRLALRLGGAGTSLRDLVMLIEADVSGRPPLPPRRPKSAESLLALAEECGVGASGPRPILLGRHLIERGMRPGRHFGEILGRAFDAQVDGAFDDFEGARRWLDAAVGRADGGLSAL